jgi:hypothetical protein
MIYIKLAQEMVRDTLRETEKARLNSTSGQKRGKVVRIR